MQNENQENKICKVCNQEKRLDQFAKYHNKGIIRYRGVCLRCNNHQARERTLKDPNYKQKCKQHYETHTKVQDKIKNDEIDKYNTEHANDRICKICFKTKDISEFRVDLWSKNRLNVNCSECLDARPAKKYKETLKQKRLENLEEARKKDREKYAKNKERNKETDKQYRLRNIEKIKEKSRVYDKNPKRQEQKRKRGSERRKTDINYNLNRKMSCSIGTAIRKYGNSWRFCVGYSVEELKSHLLSLFTEGMTWELLLAGKIHIDHIIPIAAFYYTKHTDLAFQLCWRLSNLQPLWKKENKLKSDYLSNGDKASQMIRKITSEEDFNLIKNGQKLKNHSRHYDGFLPTNNCLLINYKFNQDDTKNINSL